MLKSLVLLFAMVAAGWYLKGHAPPATSGYGESATWSLPTLGAGSGQELLARMTTTVKELGRAASGVGSLANASGFGGAVAKGGDVTLPPELLRLVNPALLTTAANGTQSLSPAGQAALRQIVAQAKGNPAALKEQLSAFARTQHSAP